MTGTSPARSENPNRRQQRNAAISEIQQGLTHSNVSLARLDASLPRLIKQIGASEVHVEESSPPQRECFFSKKKGRFILLKKKARNVRGRFCSRATTGPDG